MIAVVAVDDRFGIGLDNNLLFRCKEDQRFFRDTTLGGTVIMGRKTYLSLPKTRRPLPERRNIVMTTDENFYEEGVIPCLGIKQLIEMTEKLDKDEVFVIGGEQIYRALLPFCHKLYVTRFKSTKPADTFFPNLDEIKGWDITFKSSTYNHEGTEYNFLTYEPTNRKDCASI